MSWGFEYNGRDKEKLKTVCRQALTQSCRGYGLNEDAEKRVAPVADLIDRAIDTARIPKEADYLRVKSSGHLDGTQCYFSIEVHPVYLPKLVDG